jgi:hypothetical protein
VSQTIAPIGTAVTSLRRDPRAPKFARSDEDEDHGDDVAPVAPAAAVTATLAPPAPNAGLRADLLLITALLGQRSGTAQLPPRSRIATVRWSPPDSSFRLRDRIV